MPKNKKKNKGGGQQKSQGKQQEKRHQKSDSKSEPEKSLNDVVDEHTSSTLIGSIVTSVSNFIGLSNNTATCVTDDKESADVDPVENTSDNMSKRPITESEPKREKIEVKHESLEKADDTEVKKDDDKRAKVDPDDLEFSTELEGMSTKQKKKWKERTKKNDPNKYDRYIAFITKRDGEESTPSPENDGNAAENKQSSFKKDGKMQQKPLFDVASWDKEGDESKGEWADTSVNKKRKIKRDNVLPVPTPELKTKNKKEVKREEEVKNDDEDVLDNWEQGATGGNEGEEQSVEAIRQSEVDDYEKELKNPGALPDKKDRGTFKMGFNKKANTSKWGEEDGKKREVSNERGGGRNKSNERGGCRDKSNERWSARNKSNERGGGATKKYNEREGGARNKSNERGIGAREKTSLDDGEKKMSKNQKKKQKKQNKAQGQPGPDWPLGHPLYRPERDHQPQQYQEHYGNSSSNFNDQGQWEPQPILREDGSIVLQEVYGDLFGCPDDHCLAHCVSADMHMGKGVAVEFKKRFRGQGDLFAQGQHTGGMAYLYRQNRFIYYLVTKEEYHKKPTMHTLRSSLELMHQHIMQHNVSRLAMPMIGCGLDKLDWDQVKNMLGQMFHKTPVQITVYYL